MSPYATNMAWLKATTFAGLAALSLSDVIVVGPYAHLTDAPPIVRQREGKPLVYDAAEDRAYWGEKFGREITEVEHLEIRTNLVGFMRALMAPGLKPATGEALQ